MVVDGGGSRKVECEGGLADGGASSDDDHLTGMQSVGQSVQIPEARGHTRETAIVGGQGFHFVVSRLDQFTD